jgi:hypothetical protein
MNGLFYAAMRHASKVQVVSFLSARTRLSAAPKQVRKTKYAVTTTIVTKVISSQFISYLIVPHQSSMNNRHTRRRRARGIRKCLPLHTAACK